MSTRSFLRDQIVRDHGVSQTGHNAMLRARREWLRNATNVRITPHMPFGAILLHQRINRRADNYRRTQVYINAGIIPCPLGWDAV